MGLDQGGCACGAVRWRHTGTPVRNLVCHCDSCRRAVSGAFAAFYGVRPEDVSWTGDVGFFASSPEATRGFCKACGTALFFKSNRWPNELHLHVGTLDTPHDYTPDSHVVLQEKLSWVQLGGQVVQAASFAQDPVKQGDFNG